MGTKLFRGMKNRWVMLYGVVVETRGSSSLIFTSPRKGDHKSMNGTGILPYFQLELERQFLEAGEACRSGIRCGRTRAHRGKRQLRSG